MSHHILVVDDEKGVQRLLQELLQEAGYEVTVVASGVEALRAAQERTIDLVLTDLQLPGLDGRELVEQLARLAPQMTAVVMTGYGSIESAVAAMRAGAVDFLTKPFDRAALIRVVRDALARRPTSSRPASLRQEESSVSMIGASEALLGIRAFVEKVANSDSTVLIQGESGTGKELMARLLHNHSGRRDRSFVAINCGAIPDALLESELFGHEKGAFTGATQARPGRFEWADGGTLFLDEVGELPMALQVKLLRALQERSFERVGGTRTIHVDVRLVAATNQDLEQAMQEQRFRADLFYRLNVIPATMPALRERASDIPLLAEHCLQRLNRRKHTAVEGIDPDAMACLSAYPWPGNIRELENVIERLVVLKKSGRISVADLPEQLVCRRPLASSAAAGMDLGASGIDLAQELDRYEQELIQAALRQSNGVTSKAAQLLQLNRTTLVEKLKRKGWDARGQGDLFSLAPTPLFGPPSA